MLGWRKAPLVMASSPLRWKSAYVSGGVPVPPTTLVLSDSTIAAIKAQIKQSFQLPVEMQILTLEGTPTVLDDATTLASLGTEFPIKLSLRTQYSNMASPHRLIAFLVLLLLLSSILCFRLARTYTASRSFYGSYDFTEVLSVKPLLDEQGKPLDWLFCVKEGTIDRTPYKIGTITGLRLAK